MGVYIGVDLFFLFGIVEVYYEDIEFECVYVFCYVDGICFFEIVVGNDDEFVLRCVMFEVGCSFCGDFWQVIDEVDVFWVVYVGQEGWYEVCVVKIGWEFVIVDEGGCDIDVNFVGEDYLVGENVVIFCVCIYDVCIIGIEEGNDCLVKWK